MDMGTGDDEKVVKLAGLVMVGERVRGATAGRVRRGRLELLL